MISCCPMKSALSQGVHVLPIWNQLWSVVYMFLRKLYCNGSTVWLLISVSHFSLFSSRVRENIWGVCRILPLASFKKLGMLEGPIHCSVPARSQGMVLLGHAVYVLSCLGGVLYCWSLHFCMHGCTDLCSDFHSPWTWKCNSVYVLYWNVNFRISVSY